jgi:hypothetical protein
VDILDKSAADTLDKGSPDGSLASLTPVEEGAFKRLQLLQGQLTRNIQHVAGLNPKAFRQVVFYGTNSLDETE